MKPPVLQLSDRPVLDYPEDLEERDLLALIQRATWGFTEAAYRDAKKLGYDGFLRDQLEREEGPHPELEAELEARASLGMTARELWDAYLPHQTGIITFQLREAALIRAQRSRRQLFERLVGFWSDHFNIDQRIDLIRYLKTVDDREMLRRHALGTFHALLRASATSPAMLFYLDNQVNTARSPNENYARELMELHTLGVDGPYTEGDVRELMRCMTGWSFRQIFKNAKFGEFVFLPRTHDEGRKNVLGQEIEPGGGQQDGERMLRLLAEHPKTADFISRKLCRWLLTYDPPEEVVASVRKVFLDTDGDLTALTRTALSRESLRAARPWDAPKLKRPFHFIVSLFRVVEPTVDEWIPLMDELNRMGQMPFCHGSPDGYPDRLESWGSGVLGRWRFATRLFSGDVQGVRVPAERLGALVAGTPRQRLARRLNALFLGGLMDPTDQARIQRAIDRRESVDEAGLREAFALAAASPSFQFY